MNLHCFNGFLNPRAQILGRNFPPAARVACASTLRRQTPAASGTWSSSVCSARADLNLSQISLCRRKLITRGDPKKERKSRKQPPAKGTSNGVPANEWSPEHPKAKPLGVNRVHPPKPTPPFWPWQGWTHTPPVICLTDKIASAKELDPR